MTEETILIMQQGEGRWVKFAITNDGTALDLSTSELFFGVKQNRLDDDYVYSVANSESSKWNRSQDSLGIVKVNIPASQSADMSVDSYDASLRVLLVADTDVDISPMFTLKIVPSVIR